jgi:hypothetical protein
LHISERDEVEGDIDAAGPLRNRVDVGVDGLLVECVDYIGFG